MASLSLYAELIEKMRKQRMNMSPRTRGATKSYGSRRFKARNSQAGLQRERKLLNPIAQAMMGR
jgi:hypothetical protein